MNLSSGSNRRLVHGWEPSLRRPCFAVEPGDAGLGELVRDMRRIMQQEQGVGLAAPQAGDDRRVVLVRYPEDPPAGARVLVNPVIVQVSSDLVPFEEGCLSYPGVYRIVRRPRSITVRYQDIDGHPQELEDESFLARVIQHEIDHLDGVLFVDHLSLWNRFTVRLRMLAWRMGWRR